MSFPREFLVAFSLLVPAVMAHAQRAIDVQLQSIATVGGEEFLGVGVGLGLRTSGRMRVGLILNAGALDSLAAVRPELIGSFHLNPFKRQGVSPYAGGGVAAVFTENASREYLVAFVGLEARPGRSFGWFAEAGIGGGARVVAGIQFRRRRNRAR